MCRHGQPLVVNYPIRSSTTWHSELSHSYCFLQLNSSIPEAVKHLLNVFISIRKPDI